MGQTDDRLSHGIDLTVFYADLIRTIRLDTGHLSVPDADGIPASLRPDHLLRIPVHGKRHNGLPVHHHRQRLSRRTEGAERKPKKQGQEKDPGQEEEIPPDRSTTPALLPVSFRLFSLSFCF